MCICSWPVWSNFPMFKSNVFCILCKLFGVEWTTIICFTTLGIPNILITLSSIGIVAFPETPLRISTTGLSWELVYSHIQSSDGRGPQKSALSRSLGLVGSGLVFSDSPVWQVFPLPGMQHIFQWFFRLPHWCLEIRFWNAWMNLFSWFLDVSHMRFWWLRFWDRYHYLFSSQQNVVTVGMYCEVIL